MQTHGEPTSLLPTRNEFARGAGEIALGASLVAMIWAVPVTVRLAGISDESWLWVWLSLVTIAAPLSLLAVSLARSATFGFRRLVPVTARRHEWMSSLGLWMLYAMVALTALGWLLSAHTHHRGLAGTTAAVLGVALAAGCAVLARRTAELLGSVARRTSVAWALCVVPWLGMLAAIVVVASASPASESLPATFAVLDAALLTGLAVGGSRVRLPQRAMRVTAPSAAILMILCCCLGIPGLVPMAASDAMRARVLIASPLLHLLASHDSKPRKMRFRTGDTPQLLSTPGPDTPGAPP